MLCKATFVDNVGAQFPGQPLQLTTILSCLPPPAGASPKWWPYKAGKQIAARYMSSGNALTATIWAVANVQTLGYYSVSNVQFCEPGGTIALRYAVAALTTSVAFTDETFSSTWVGRSHWGDDAYFDGDIAGLYVNDEYASDEKSALIAIALKEGLDLAELPCIY